MQKTAESTTEGIKWGEEFEFWTLLQGGVVEGKLGKEKVKEM